MFFFFKQKTAYEMRISDWSSDVCSSDLRGLAPLIGFSIAESDFGQTPYLASSAVPATVSPAEDTSLPMPSTVLHALTMNIVAKNASPTILRISVSPRSEEHTPELQSLMRNSYAVLCLKKQKKNK